MDNTTNDNQTNTAQTGDQTIQMDPGQTSMFDGNTSEDVTKMEIGHETATYNIAAEKTEAATEEKDEIPNSTKIKVLAALAIVAVAGYIAYWVQDPVQLKADVLSGTDSGTTTTSDPSTPTSTTTSTDSTATTTDTSTTSGTTATPTSTSTVADADTGTSKNVDVSLFGFEPAVLKIDKGTTVIWTNTSTEDQTLIGSSDNGESFTSPVMTAGTTFNYKFDNDGTYQYYSTYNPALKATITVGTGTAASAVSTTATTTSPDPTSAASTTGTTSTTTDSATSAADAANLAAVAAADSGTPDGLFNSAPETAIATSATTAVPSTTDSLNNANNSEMSALAASAASSQEDLKGSAPSKLPKSGPTEDMYAVVLLGIAWFNRKKLVKIFKK